jgi:hypothetical protein
MPPRHTGPLDRSIMHFTHIDNLAQILVDGALYSDTRVGAKLVTEVGDRSIKSMRRRNIVTCGPDGCPADYVPFYFAARSPMMYRIARGSVAQYHDGQSPLVYLVTTVGTIVESGLHWVFSNGNCGSPTTEYFDDLGLLDTKVDWDLMRAKLWHDTADDPTRATRRAAEFLVHEQVPWQLVRHVVARTSATARQTRDTISRAGWPQPVSVAPSWYYAGEQYR